MARLTQTELVELAKLVEDMVRLGEEGEATAMSDVDVRFHRTIVEAAGHSLLLSLWSTVNPTLWTHVAIVGFLGLPPAAIANRHRAIVAAMKTGDPAVARTAATQHLLELRDLAVAQLAEPRASAVGSFSPTR